MTNFYVLGAGVVGIATAYALAQQGFGVSVVDSASGPGEGGASFGNGAQLSYSYTDALASPNLVKHLPGLLVGRDPAFRITPTCSLLFVRWGLELLRNATKERFQENTLHILQLALESRSAMAELRSRHSLSFAFRRSAKMHLYSSEAAFSKARAAVGLKEKFGVGQEILSPQEAVGREPALETYAGKLVGAVWSPLDEAGDCHLFCRELSDVLAAQYGVKFHYGMTVTGLKADNQGLCSITTSAGEINARHAVVALGSASSGLLQTVGLRVPIWPIQGYSVTLPATKSTPDVSITDTANKIVFCRLAEKVRIAGLADIGGQKPPFVSKRLQVLLLAAKSAFPRAAEYGAGPQAWSGLRPMTPSSQPLISASRIEGLYLNCGHGMLGWTLAAGSAFRLAEIIRNPTARGHTPHQMRP